MKKLLLPCLLAFASVPASAEDYTITQYRAAPGNFPALLELVKGTDWNTIGDGAPIMMRHSQGNHWDLMLLSKSNTECSAKPKCAEAKGNFDTKARNLVDFERRFTATSETSWGQIRESNKTTGLYHIEMFNAAAGKHDALRRQRRIENDYLVKTGQVKNVVFDVIMGTDIDIFTVGFHKNLTVFAQQGPSSAEAAEKAAVEAGFKDRADISFHLRELIVGHHDTLAVPVK